MLSLSYRSAQIALTFGFISLTAIGYLKWSDRPVMLVNGHIMTMDEADSTVSALLMREGRIAVMGATSDLLALQTWFTNVIDLEGRYVLPGFVDAHSHFPSSGLTKMGLDLTPEPIGTISTVDDILTLVGYAAKKTSEDDWIIGFNYDDAGLVSRKHPTRQALDRVAPSHAVYLRHRSGHMGVANSKALAALGYSDRQPTLFRDSRLPDSQATGHVHQPQRDAEGLLTGLLQERAAPDMATLLRDWSLLRLFKVFLAAKNEYLKAGITTVQNGYADIATLRFLKWAQRLRLLPQRVVAWPAHDKVANRLAGNLPDGPDFPTINAVANALSWSKDTLSYSMSAVKLVADGSPQGRTAWLSEPYLNTDGSASAYRGHPHMLPADFQSAVMQYHRAGLPLALHGNGDAGIDLIIQSLQKAQQAYPKDDMRHNVVHGQTIRFDQLEALARLGATITFFPSHTFFWGDWYVSDVLGPERAYNISPLSWADKVNLRYSIHTDAPVTPMDPMLLLWTATHRQTLTGQMLNTSLAISRKRALRAMTIDAAWQNRVEHNRGSLEVGKLADLIVLSDDPLSIGDVRDIEVERVWIGGKSVYQAYSDVNPVFR